MKLLELTLASSNRKVTVILINNNEQPIVITEKIAFINKNSVLGSYVAFSGQEDDYLLVKETREEIIKML